MATNTTAGTPLSVMSSTASGGMNVGIPVDTLDNEAAGAVQHPEDAELHVDPYNAAKQLRKLARNLRDYVAVVAAPKDSQSSPTSAFIDRVHRARERQKKTELDITALRSMQSKEYQESQRITELLREGGPLWEAIVNRRAGEAKDYLTRVRVHVVRLDQHSAMARTYAANARTHNRDCGGWLQQAFDYADVAQSEPENGAAEAANEANKKKVQELCDKIHVLTQSLPTIANAPVEKNQMILRAIATLLKNGGMLESSITTEGEGK